MDARARLAAALHKAAQHLLQQRHPDGHWEGRLSSSALSTATAVIALAVSRKSGEKIRPGLDWLARHQSPDGGWGDTPKSRPNISTTALCWAAFGAAQADTSFPETVHRAELWLAKASSPESTVKPQSLAAALSARYGRDRTFSVPILMALALSGRLGPGGWRLIPALPFELAVFPRELFGALQLPVVSYALPALIAIGQILHQRAPSRNPLVRLIRNVARAKTLRVLSTLQPENGGFLEATPLTSFVAMSLAGMSQPHPVLDKALAFLDASVREDGSWPIDSHLATWVTTLSLKALSRTELPEAASAPEQARPWILRQQYTQTHPYTLAAPGAWSWTPLPGGVPDADDTAGALLALLPKGTIAPSLLRAGLEGCRWLLNLQNRDGGIPTFCRGWGTLPFDRSSPDLTAHALRAWAAWLLRVGGPARLSIAAGMERALLYLARSQNPDGSWTPLWFGNEQGPDEANPTYGTACVLLALEELRLLGFRLPPEIAGRATRWLLAAQNVSGAWGGAFGTAVSTEETGLAVEALASCEPEAATRGALWLASKIEEDSWTTPSPIGFYFAKLWYFEDLYPQIFTVAGMGRLLRHL